MESGFVLTFTWGGDKFDFPRYIVLGIGKLDLTQPLVLGIGEVRSYFNYKRGKQTTSGESGRVYSRLFIGLL
jgi:hypothetical protein